MVGGNGGVLTSGSVIAVRHNKKPAPFYLTVRDNVSFPSTFRVRVSHSVSRTRL